MQVGADKCRFIRSYCWFEEAFSCSYSWPRIGWNAGRVRLKCKSLQVLGGDALNGHADAGRFFLANHGKLIETTEGMFRYSAIHGASLFVTTPLAMVFAFSASWRRAKLQKSAGGTTR